MTASTNPIAVSFECAAARGGDLTPVVYERLFARHPETRALFRTHGSELVMGSMLALTIEAMLDFAGERRGPFRLIACEASSHDSYGTPRDLFVSFFGIIRDAVRDLLGEEWTPEIAQAWEQSLTEIEAFAREN